MLMKEFFKAETKKTKKKQLEKIMNPQYFPTLIHVLVVDLQEENSDGLAEIYSSLGWVY